MKLEEVMENGKSSSKSRASKIRAAKIKGMRPVGVETIVRHIENKYAVSIEVEKNTKRVYDKISMLDRNQVTNTQHRCRRLGEFRESVPGIYQLQEQ